jgi:tRNA (guanine-N7-)-methyltransferase
MGKNKLKKFAEMETFSNVFQCGIQDLETSEVKQMAGHWREKFFKNDNPIVLELGCGRGEYTVGLAQRDPNKNYIGIDIKGARMWAGAKQAELAQMSNVAFLRTNIEMLCHFFAPDEVDEIWITFPDPQMKKVTKRLTSTYFMERYRQVLRPDGIIHLKTDRPFLYAYTDAMVKENNYPIVVNTNNLYQAEPTAKLQEAQCLQTHYEKQWLDRGMTIKYITWQLPSTPSLIEPDIDIEKDSYRSYGRNYVSTTNI